MDSMPIIPLSDDQTQKIKILAESAPEQLMRRARLILAYASGKPTIQAAHEAGISRGRARFWKRQFFVKGMSIFNLNATYEQSAEPTPTPAEGSAGVTPPETVIDTGDELLSSVQFDHPYPVPKESIGVSPDDSLAAAGRKVWLFHFALMLSHEKGTLEGEEIEELHDMRVATRRMRTAFNVFSPAFEPKVLKPYLNGLRKVGRTLGAVRDMDVILENAVSYQSSIKNEKQPNMEPLLSKWKQSIEKKRAKLRRHLGSKDYQTFKHDFNEFLQTSEDGRTPKVNCVMNPQLRDIVPVLVYGRFAAVRAYESILPTATMQQLHALRIEVKMFRYVLEYFREILNETTGSAISELKRLQDHLGELHDRDVACQLVDRFLKTWEEEQLTKPISDRQNPEPIVSYLAYLNAERYRLLCSFPELWAKFNRPEFRHNIAQAISQL
jgi:CHAD domain-containing protein